MKSAASGAQVTSADPDKSGQLPSSDLDSPDERTSPDSAVMRTQLAQVAREIESALQDLLSAGEGSADDRAAATHSKLANAMRYSLEAGGKRLRPALLLWCCEACGGQRADALPAAVAIECVHTFSLIHDDLPALDNDDLRRGRPTNHRVFGEATAILAGDGLLALAFESIARGVTDPVVAAAQVYELAAAAGWRGMIGGESLDLEGEQSPPSESLATQIAMLKTARLIESACLLGAMAARADEATQTALSRYGRSLGMAFQIADDLLDASGDGERLGKRAQKDAGAGKQTLVGSVGMEAARRAARRHADEAIAAVAPLGVAGERLAALAEFVIERDS